MAELNEAESTKDTKKTKKEKKMEEKAAKKAAKKAKKNHEADKPDAENDDSDSVSSKIVMVLVTILIIAIWLGIFAVFVKADVGGFGSTVLAPALKDVPVLSKILPDSGNITASESTETAGYTNLDDAVSRIKELEKQLDDANSKNQADAQTINDLNAQIQDLSTYKEEQAAFEEEKEKYYEEAIEKYSVLRARMAVERATVCVIMIDAQEGFTEQDSKVAGIAHDLGKACIIAVNKWDAVEKDGKTMDSYRKKLMNDFSFMSYAPIIFISAKTGQRLDRLFELIKFVDTQNAMRISTGKLNDILAEATARVQPPTDKGRRLKIYYITQASTRPPTFVCFVNRKDLFHYSYQRYIDNQIREVFGLEGTPTKMVIRERDEKK